MFNKDNRRSRSSVTESWVKEIVETKVREAVNAQARELETHLQNIHKRLVDLEKK